MKTLTASASLALLILIAPSFAQANDEGACTMQYQPVCGTDKGTYTTYGNGCTLGAEGAVYQHEGECTLAELEGKPEGAYVPPAHCTAWNDGCNSCARQGSGEAACTLMACMDAPRAGFCTMYEETAVEEPAAPIPSAESPVEAAPVAEATTTATTSPEAASGFFTRVWRSVAGFFMDLF